VRTVVVVVAVLIAAAAAPRGERSVRPLQPSLAALEPAQGLGAVTSGRGDAWVDDRWGERLLRLDRSTGRVVARIPVQGRLALGDGGPNVWALQSGGGYGRNLRGPLLRIDAATSRVMARIPLAMPDGDPVFGFGVVAAGDDVWVWGPRDLLRIDGRTDTLARVIEVPDRWGETTGFVLLGGQPLITTADNHLVRIGADHVRAVPLALGAPVVQQATAGQAIVTSGGTVAAVDPDTGAVLWRRRLGFRIGTVLPARGKLWVQGAYIRDPGDRVWELDPATGATLGSALLPAFGSIGMVAIDDTLWVTTAAGRLLVLPLPT
jgi:hypothetical protein